MTDNNLAGRDDREPWALLREMSARAARAEADLARVTKERDALQAHVDRLNAAVQRHSDRAAAAQEENLAQFAEAVAKVTPCTCSAQRARADRAVAERDELADKVRALADKWASFGTHTWFRQIHVAAAETLRALLDGGERA